MPTPGAKRRVQNKVITPVVPASTWNPSDKGASVVLSGGDYTATKAGSGYQSVRGVRGNSSGVRYYELSIVSGPSSGAYLVGVANSSFTLTGRYLGENNAGSKKSAGRGVGQGNWYRNLTNAASNAVIANVGTGALVGIGMNFSTFTITIYNALTGALLATYVDASPWGTMFPAATLQNGGVVTLIASGPFAFLPAGFIAWDAP